MSLILACYTVSVCLISGGLYQFNYGLLHSFSVFDFWRSMSV